MVALFTTSVAGPRATIQRGVDDADDADGGDDGDDGDTAASDLATSVAQDFLLTDVDVGAIASAILDGRMDALAASYIAAAKAAGAVPPADWIPSAALEDAASDAADAAAASIAATYASDVGQLAATFTQRWMDTHDGALDGARLALRDALATYTEARAPWKSAQVASYETGQGAHTGTQAAVSDLGDGELLDDSGEALDTTLLAVAVLPETSSADFCAEYAGNVYAFDDAPDLEFPAHVACSHYCVILVSSEYSLGFDMS